MKRITVFVGTREDAHQAVIVESSLEAFKGLGFVCSVDDLPVSESGSDREKLLREQIRSLGGRPGGRSSIDTLERQLERLQNDNNQD